jgi:hypothetical protein
VKREGWTKVPSATPGGKPFFYHNKALKRWVVWDREQGAWVVSSVSVRVIKFRRQSFFQTPTQAAIAAEGK